ncbi:MAG: aldo/keto reductase [FCB group bacterium]|nr:aldo/keto reductase [FCB group bacterium]
MEKRYLGKTDIQITPIGLGCWQFSGGKGLVGRFWKALDSDHVRDIIANTIREGINWFDTAEVYGWGNSERMLSSILDVLAVKPGEVMIATKWWPVLRRAGSISETFKYRQVALGEYPIDLYQVHNPFSLSSVKAQMDAMAALVKDQKIRSIGVSNFSASAMGKAARVLESQGLVLASNQVRYSLLDRRIEENGVLTTAQEKGITIIAYSPLEQGILTGKFHDNPDLIKSRTGPRKYLKWFKSKGLAASRPLVQVLKEIGERVQATPEQVALNWIVNRHGKTVVAIPGASKPRHATSNARSLAFQLTTEEMERIDQVSWEAIRR